MQTKLPDPTPYLPWVLALLLAAWKVWEEISKARENIRKGKKAEATEREEEVHKTLAPVERRAKEAEALLELREKRLAIVETEKLRAEAEVERLKQRLAERDETEDKLQTAMNNIVGRLDELGRVVERLRARGKSDDG